MFVISFDLKVFFFSLYHHAKSSCSAQPDKPSESRQSCSLILWTYFSENELKRFVLQAFAIAFEKMRFPQSERLSSEDLRNLSLSHTRRTTVLS